MRWIGTLLSMIVCGSAVSASASDDVCVVGSRLMSVAQAASSSGAQAGSQTPADALTSMHYAWAASMLEPSPTILAPTRDERAPARAILMCVGTDPARCLPAAPPPPSVRFEIGRSPRAQTASGWDDVAPPGWARVSFAQIASGSGPAGIRSRVDRPPRDARRT